MQTVNRKKLPCACALVVFRLTSVTKDSIGPYSDSGKKQQITTAETEILWAC